jgi:hypothetical protein
MSDTRGEVGQTVEFASVPLFGVAHPARLKTTLQEAISRSEPMPDNPLAVSGWVYCLGFFVLTMIIIPSGVSQ